MKDARVRRLCMLLLCLNIGKHYLHPCLFRLWAMQNSQVDETCEFDSTFRPVNAAGSSSILLEQRLSLKRTHFELSLHCM